MDDIDKKILKRLQENARVTISVLSSEISLSMPAISERLRKLEASGVIKQYTAILNPELVDKQLMALVYLSFDNPSHGDSFKILWLVSRTSRNASTSLVTLIIP